MRFLKSWLPVIVWAAMILSAANDRFSATNSQGWLERLFGRDVSAIVNLGIRKGAHIGVYAILGVLAWRADRRVLVALAISIAVAIADETTQAHTLTRSGSVADVLLDAFSAALAVGLLHRLAARGRPPRE